MHKLVRRVSKKLTGKARSEPSVGDDGEAASKEEAIAELFSKKVLTRDEAARIKRAMSGGAEPPSTPRLFFLGDRDESRDSDGLEPRPSGTSDVEWATARPSERSAAATAAPDALPGAAAAPPTEPPPPPPPPPPLRPRPSLSSAEGGARPSAAESLSVARESALAAASARLAARDGALGVKRRTRDARSDPDAPAYVLRLVRDGVEIAEDVRVLQTYANGLADVHCLADGTDCTVKLTMLTRRDPVVVAGCGASQIESDSDSDDAVGGRDAGAVPPPPPPPVEAAAPPPPPTAASPSPYKKKNRGVKRKGRNKNNDEDGDEKTTKPFSPTLGAFSLSKGGSGDLAARRLALLSQLA